MTAALEKADLFTTGQADRKLKNIFTGKLATSEQSSDLLNFYDIGKAELEAYIKSRVMLEANSAPRDDNKICVRSLQHQRRRKDKNKRTRITKLSLRA